MLYILGPLSCPWTPLFRMDVNLVEIYYTLALWLCLLWGVWVLLLREAEGIWTFYSSFSLSSSLSFLAPYLLNFLQYLPLVFIIINFLPPMVAEMSFFSTLEACGPIFAVFPLLNVLLALSRITPALAWTDYLVLMAIRDCPHITL